MHQDLLTLEEITYQDLFEIMELSTKLKMERGSHTEMPLAGKSVGMIFAKSSTRTRISFEVGVKELGGYPIYLDQNTMQIGRGETIADTARVLSRYLHAVIIRTYAHSDVVDLAKHSHIPIINALTDEYHPCQVLTDLFTIYELSEKFEGIKLAYLGDGASNMANSLMLGSKLAGLDLVIGSPEEYKPDISIAKDAAGEGKISWTTDPHEAVKDADYIYTDVWVSMGDEAETEKRLKILKPYQVNMELLSAASSNVKVLHCLPAHRNEEITDDVMESPQAVVFDQAENRLHVQKAILTLMLGGK